MRHTKMTILELIFERNGFTGRQMIGWAVLMIGAMVAMMVAL